MGHLWLVGMMGTGKTTVGGAVAERLTVPFYDMDAEIMERSGKTVPELFDEGESVFRDWESRVVEDLAGRESAVIATGGGAVLKVSNVAAMHSSGTIVLLTASPEALIERIGDDPQRPLASDGESIRRLLELRRHIYEAVASETVDTTDRTIDEVAEEVERCFTS